MKTAKIIYWISTIALALFILPGIFFLNTPMAVEGMNHVGPFPQRFMLEAGIGAFIGGLILIIPKLPARLKEWGYVGLGLIYISAFIAHLSVDGITFMTFTPMIAFAVLLTSYLSYHKIHKVFK